MILKNPPKKVVKFDFEHEIQLLEWNCLSVLKLLQSEIFSIFLDFTLDDVIENLTLSVWLQKVVKI